VLRAAAAPASLKGVTGRLEIRGELYWPRAAFDRHNETLDPEDKIANPRNGCAG
jgi:DNA ligase (NAD+)